MSKHHAFREDIKLRIAEVRDDVMKEPTLSVGEKKEVSECYCHFKFCRIFYIVFLS